MIIKRLSLLLLFLTQDIHALEKINYISLEIDFYQLQRISNANKSDLLHLERSELPNSNQRKLQNFNSQNEIRAVINIQNDLPVDFESTNTENLFLSDNQEGVCLNTNCSYEISKTRNDISLKKIVKKRGRSNDLIIMFHTLAFITLLAIIFVFNVYYCGSIMYSTYKEKLKLISK